MVIKPTDRAFPISNGGVSGMQLRTWMATQIAAGLAVQNYFGSDTRPRDIANGAVVIADALIAELNK